MCDGGVRGAQLLQVAGIWEKGCVCGRFPSFQRREFPVSDTVMEDSHVTGGRVRTQAWEQ